MPVDHDPTAATCLKFAQDFMLFAGHLETHDWGLGVSRVSLFNYVKTAVNDGAHRILLIGH